jgi:hypothetical protein
MHFLKGSQQVINQGDDIPNWEEQANKVRRQMSELFDAQNLSFLFGSGCSSMCKDAEEHGIPTMGPLAKEFKSWFEGMPNLNATVTCLQKDQLLAQVSYCQIWCLRVVGHAAIWSGFVVSIPSLNVTPVMTFAR